MAVKYKRESYTERALGTQGRLESIDHRKPADPKRRLLLIYVGLGAASVLIYVFHTISFRNPDRWVYEANARGVVTALEEVGGEDGAYVLTVRVPIPLSDDPNPEIATFEDTVGIPATSAELFEVGMTIGVDYRTPRSRNRVTITEIYLLPEETAESPVP